MTPEYITIPITHTIPHSHRHEMDVISTLMKNPEKFDEYPALTAEHFHQPDTKTMFAFFAEMRAEHHHSVLDVSSLVYEINKRGLFERIGGACGLGRLMEQCSITEHLPQHVERLNELYARRLAIAAGLALVRSAFEDDTPDLVEAAGSPVTAIHDALTASRPPLSTKTIITECIAAYEGRLRGTQSPMGITTIPEIDVYLRGLHPGRVVIIGAPSGGGKSVLGSQMILECALTGNSCMEINYEMRESDSMNRKIIQVSRVPSEAFMDPINYGLMNDTPPTNKGFLQKLQRASLDLTAAPIRLVRPSNRQLRTLMAVIRKGVREHGVKVVSIDYLQLIRCKAGSSEGEISEISHSLQELAQELGISILLLSQLNANGDTKHGVVAIEDCDAYLVIQQETDKQAENYGQHYDILLSKDRHNGNQGKSIPLIFDSNLVRFVHGFVSRKKAPAGPKKKAGF